jgi:transposase
LLRRGNRRLLAAFGGSILQVDGHAAYKPCPVGTASGGARLLLAHERRKFAEAHKTAGSRFAAELIKTLANVCHRGAYPRQERRGQHVVRQAETKPILDKLAAAIKATFCEVSRQSNLATACRNTLDHWGLKRFLDDGGLESAPIPDDTPDRIGKTQLSHRRQRGRRPNLGDPRSLITTARLNGVDPFAWLVDVMERIA